MNAPLLERAVCRLCGGSSRHVGKIHGRFSGRDYELRHCGSCRYRFVADPWTEFDRIYDEGYYAGRGADPIVDYQFELARPDRTIRHYEWRGTSQVVEGLLGGLGGVRWLDFGCGNGSLVRYVREHTPACAWGFDESSIVDQARGLGIPILSEDGLRQNEGSFDVVTAIEVLEHTVDPLAALRQIRAALRPGGLLFLTTGNVLPFARRLPNWRYVVPEIHVSFFEPRTLAYAMQETGFRPEWTDLGSGFDQIMKFKVLKNLRIRRRSHLTDLIPARPLAALSDRYVRLSEHPVGWAA